MLRRNEHPGKYEGGLVIDEHVHGLTLEGWQDEECGDVSELGWFGLLKGPIDLPADVDVTAEERAFLGRIAGAIVSEDNNGFVSVEYFANGDDDGRDDRWGVIEDAYADADEDAEKEDSDDVE